MSPELGLAQAKREQRAEREAAGHGPRPQAGREQRVCPACSPFTFPALAARPEAPQPGHTCDVISATHVGQVVLLAFHGGRREAQRAPVTCPHAVVGRARTPWRSDTQPWVPPHPNRPSGSGGGRTRKVQTKSSPISGGSPWGERGQLWLRTSSPEALSGVRSYRGGGSPDR